MPENRILSRNGDNFLDEAAGKIPSPAKTKKIALFSILLLMKKYRFHKSAIIHFNEMATEKLEAEITKSLEALSTKIPRNHKEELLITSNYKRVNVLKLILQYKNQPVLKSKVEEIAVL